jgi:hypothetical protein
MNKYQKLFLALSVLNLLPNFTLMFYNLFASDHGVLGIETFFIMLCSIFLVFAAKGMKWAGLTLFIITLFLAIPTYLLLFFYPMLPLHKLVSGFAITCYVVFLIGFLFVFPKLSRIDK